MKRKLMLAAAVLALGVMAIDDRWYAGETISDKRLWSNRAHSSHGYVFKPSEAYRKRSPAMASEVPPLGATPLEGYGQPNVTCGYQGGPKSPMVCRVR